MPRQKRFDGTVSIRLPKELHDDLSREALRRDVELSRVIRERLAFRISKRGDEKDPAIVNAV